MSLTPDLSDTVSVPDDVSVRRMIALFDYDPWESSPNMDSEVSAPPNQTLNSIRTKLNLRLFQAEMGFRCGDIIYVLGDMDQDGFYYVRYSLQVLHRFYVCIHGLNFYFLGGSSRSARFGSIKLPAAVTLELEETR